MTVALMLDQDDAEPDLRGATALDARFDYGTAFGRTIGWITEAEQSVLRQKKVAIAGMGGVGGAHLLTLARLGIERFAIADPDVFELANFNRQAGASMASLTRGKVEVMGALARDINPTMAVEGFDEGISEGNVDAFLEGADLYVDSLDLFALDVRRLVFERCAARGIPAISAAPLGMGTAWMTFLPNRTTFEEFFRLEGYPPDEQLLRFLIGLAPTAMQRFYLAERDALNLTTRLTPSTPMAIDLCAGVAGTTALKILLGRGRVLAAPWGLHFDAYAQRFRRTWRPGGNRNPVQRFLIFMARRNLRR